MILTCSIYQIVTSIMRVQFFEDFHQNIIVPVRMLTL